jgi:ABC-type Fe3+ transport system permease subunit
MVVEGDFLYAAGGLSGLVIFNISDVANNFVPVSFTPEIANTSTTNFIHLYNDLILLGKNERGFTIIDVSDVNAPEYVSNVTMDTDVYDLAIHDSYVYIVGYSTGLAVYDISDPFNPISIQTYNVFPDIQSNNLRTQDIQIINDVAYIAHSDGFAMLNISNPLDVTYIGALENEINGEKSISIDVSDENAFVIIYNDLTFDYGFKILSFSNVSNIYEITRYQSPLYRTQAVLIDELNNRIFLAQEKGGTFIFDISSPSSLVELAIYNDTNVITIHTFSGKNRGVILNTIILGVATTLFSILLGTALAFILARYEFPGKKLVSMLALAPLIIPPFISGMGFRLILGPSGFVNNFILVPLFSSKIIITGFVAICFVQTSHFYALVYLNAFSSFINIDPSMEESAENLGASKLKLFTSVTLPLAMPGIGAGSILVLILAMEDVGTPIIFAAMGDNAAKEYLTYWIFEKFQTQGSPVIKPEVLVLGAILLIIAIIGFLIIRRYVSLRKYAMISKGRAGEYRMSKPRWKLLFIYPFLIVLFAFSLLVHVGVFLMSIMETLGPTTASDIKFTFENYKLIFVSSIYNIPPFVVNTLVYSITATILIIIIGSLAAYVISRKDFRGKTLMDALVTIPIAIPGIVLAIGYYMTFNWSGMAGDNPTWFNNMMADLTSTLRLDPFIGVAVTLLVISYTIRKIPFTVRSAFAGLQQTDEVLEEASFNLGASRMRTFTKVTVPLISLNVFAGSLVSFIYCLSEVSTTIFLIFEASAGTLTWYMAWNPLKFQIFCALGVILMLLQIFSLFVTNVILGSRAEAITGI